MKKNLPPRSFLDFVQMINVSIPCCFVLGDQDLPPQMQRLYTTFYPRNNRNDLWPPWHWHTAPHNQPCDRQFLRPDTSEGMSSNWSALNGPQSSVRVHSESAYIRKQCLKWVASRPSNKEYCQKKKTQECCASQVVHVNKKTVQIRPSSSKCLLLPQVDTSCRAALAGASIPWCFVVFYPNHETGTLRPRMPEKGMHIVMSEPWGKQTWNLTKTYFHYTPKALETDFFNENSFHRNLPSLDLFSRSKDSAHLSLFQLLKGDGWQILGATCAIKRHRWRHEDDDALLHLFEWSHHTDLGKWRAWLEENHSETWVS